MKRWSTAILSILAVVFAAYSGYLSMENRSLKRQLAVRDLVPAAVKAPVEEMVSEALEAEPVGGEERRRFFAEGERPDREAFMERWKEQRAEQLGRMLAAFEDPELRMDMIERAMGRIDRSYAELFRRLRMSPEEIDALKTLMAEQGVLRMEGQMRTMAATEEERAAIREDLKFQQKALSEDIFALLGEKNSGTFKKYSATLKYRGDVESFERTLSYSDTPMTKRQSEGLVNVYAAVGKDFEYTYDLSEMRRGGQGQITQEAVDTYYQEREIYDTMLLEKATRVLSEAQLASLATQQISEREREQRQMQYQLDNGGSIGGRGGFDGGGFRGGGGGGRPGGGGGRGR